MNDLELIKSSINDRINWEKCQKFYIGKTNDFERRNSEHEREGYNLIWQLAKGTPTNVRKVEDSLLQQYKNHPKSLNKNSGSAGDSNAKILYLACQCDLELYELQDDILPISEKFPIDLNSYNK